MGTGISLRRRGAVGRSVVSCRLTDVASSRLNGV